MLNKREVKMKPKTELEILKKKVDALEILLLRHLTDHHRHINEKVDLDEYGTVY